MIARLENEFRKRAGRINLNRIALARVSVLADLLGQELGFKIKLAHGHPQQASTCLLLASLSFDWFLLLVGTCTSQC